MILRFDRILALCRRLIYVYLRSNFRILDLVFWPVMDLVVWGFVSVYFMRLGSDAPPHAVTFLIGSVVFYNILMRAQQSISVSFLEDVWSRNLLNVFLSPISLAEFVASTYLFGFGQIVIVFSLLSVLAASMYAFDMLSFSYYLVPLFINLVVFGWSLGMIATGLTLRFGHQAEPLAWALPYLVQPVSAVFYPVTVLPAWMHPVAYMVPATYAFEGMRAVLKGAPGADILFAKAAVANLILWCFAAWLLGRMLRGARERGALAKLVS